MSGLAERIYSKGQVASQGRAEKAGLAGIAGNRVQFFLALPLTLSSLLDKGLATCEIGQHPPQVLLSSIVRFPLGLGQRAGTFSGKRLGLSGKLVGHGQGFGVQNPNIPGCAFEAAMSSEG